MLHYFLVGMEDILAYDVIYIPMGIIAVIIMLIFCRRLSITLQSGGRFWSPYEIKDGFFYIHSGIVPGKRKIVLKNIDQVNIHLINGRNSNGDRYHIELEMIEGRNKAFFVGQSKRVKDKIIDMRRQLRKKRVKVYYYDYTK